MAGDCSESSSYGRWRFCCTQSGSGDPNGVNKSTEELIAVVKEVAEAIDCPLVVEGCKNVRRMELLPKVAEGSSGRNVVYV